MMACAAEVLPRRGTLLSRSLVVGERIEKQRRWKRKRTEGAEAALVPRRALNTSSSHLSLALSPFLSFLCGRRSVLLQWDHVGRVHANALALLSPFLLLQLKEKEPSLPWRSAATKEQGEKGGDDKKRAGGDQGARRNRANERRRKIN